MAAEGSSQRTASLEAPVPKVSILFCIQCKWNLRAAYFAQELLQTFSTSLGEVCLRPSTGGVFIVTLETLDAESNVETHVLWDRKRDGGFPETKELKKKVRDIIDPKRDLGHVDGKKSVMSQDQQQQEPKAGQAVKTSIEASNKQNGGEAVEAAKDKTICEDCQ